VRFDLLPDGRHDEDGQEQGEAQQHLVRRELGDADRVAREREDDDDPRERGDHHQQRGQERQEGKKEEELQPRVDGPGAAGGRPTGVDAQLRVAQLGVGGAGGEPEDGTREQPNQGGAAQAARPLRHACRHAVVVLDAVADHDRDPPDKTRMRRVRRIARSLAQHAICTSTVYVH